MLSRTAVPPYPMLLILISPENSVR